MADKPNEKPNENLEKLNKLQQEIELKTKKWNGIIAKLSNDIKCELKESINVNAEAISYRQILIDERVNYSFKLYKHIPQLKIARKNYFEYYSQKYAIKTNSSEKTKLIEADMAYFEAKIEYIKNYIDYLSDSIKTVDHIIYSMKNKIDLYNATGLD